MILKKYKCTTYCHKHSIPMIVSMFTYFLSRESKECFPHEIWFLKKHFFCDNISTEEEEEENFRLNFHPIYEEHEDDMIYTKQDKTFSSDFELLEKYI